MINRIAQTVILLSISFLLLFFCSPGIEALRADSAEQQITAEAYELHAALSKAKTIIIKQKIAEINKRLKTLRQRYDKEKRSRIQYKISTQVQKLTKKLWRWDTKLPHKVCNRFNALVGITIENNSQLPLKIQLIAQQNLATDIEPGNSAIGAASERLFEVPMSELSSYEHQYLNHIVLLVNGSVPTEVETEHIVPLMTPTVPRGKNCYRKIKIRVRDRDFGLEGTLPDPIATPTPQPSPLRLSTIDGPEDIKSGSAVKGDLSISWEGDAQFPITVRYFPNSCPVNVNCTTVYGEIEDQYDNPYVMFGAIWCTGAKTRIFFDYAVQLEDAAGQKSQVKGHGFNCIP